MQSSLLLLAEAVADGEEIDWDYAESSAETPEERRVVQQLRQLAAVSQSARDQITSWGPLEIRQEIGRGTFGTVYRAWDNRLQREVALKLLQKSATEVLASTVIQEGQFLARIRHENVVTVYGADVFDDRVGIWMEFVPGRTLKAIVDEQGPFGPHEAVLIARDLCRALAAVHQQGVVHRDIKAQNVMRAAGGRTVLMDFGAGAVLKPGDTDAPALSGTPAYMAPEVLAGAAPSNQSDIYSLGVLLFFLVSREFPAHASSLPDLRALHQAGKRRLLRDVRADLPPGFVRLVDQALSAAPSDRPQSAGAMEALLERALVESDAPRSSKGATNRRWLTAVAAVLVAVVSFSAWAWRESLPWRGTAVVERDSVAIVPFRSVGTPDADTDYFSMGLSQDLAAHLSSLSGVRIVSGASVSALAKTSQGPTDLARALGVTTVLEGTVARSGPRMQIATALLNGSTGETLWRESFDRDVQDVSATQSELARKVALALRGRLNEGDAARLERGQTTDSEAFLLYLQGRHALELRTDKDLSRSIQLFEQAAQRDPRYALAFVGIADAYTSLGAYEFLPRATAYLRAAEAAERAVALDDTLAEAHVSLAQARKNRFEWEAAETSFRRAIALKPGYATAHHWYSIYLTQQARFAEAIVEVKAAMAIDPLSIGASMQMASLLGMARRYEDSIAQYQAASRMDATLARPFRGMSEVYTHMGLYARAEEALAETQRRTPPDVENQELKAARGMLLAASGRRAEAVAIARDLTRRYDRAGEPVTGNIAAIYAALGDREAALMWLRRAVESRDPEVGYLKVDPRWDALRADRRFEMLLIELGLGRPQEGSR